MTSGIRKISGKPCVEVTEPPFLAQRVAVIGRQDDDALVVDASRLQRVDEPAEAGIQTTQLRGDRRVESRIVLGRRRLPQDVGQVQILRQRVGEQRIARRGHRVERALEVCQHRAHVARHQTLARGQLDGAGRSDVQMADDRVRAHREPVLFALEQSPQRVHRRERQHVLTMRQQAAAEDRRHGQSGSSVAGERVAEDQALRGERVNAGRERHGGVVRRQVVRPQAVDDEEEDVRALPPLGGGWCTEVDRAWEQSGSTPPRWHSPSGSDRTPAWFPAGSRAHRRVS